MRLIGNWDTEHKKLEIRILLSMKYRIRPGGNTKEEMISLFEFWRFLLEICFELANSRLMGREPEYKFKGTSFKLQSLENELQETDSFWTTSISKNTQ